MTLREICELTGVSRRAIQGYEKGGLVFPIGRNKRGYLLYDENAMEKIKKIKLFQEMGFSIKEIQVLEQASDSELKIQLENRKNKLKTERGRIDNIICIMEEMINHLS